MDHRQPTQRRNQGWVSEASGTPLLVQYCICWIRHSSRVEATSDDPPLQTCEWTFTLKVANEVWPQQLAYAHTVSVLANSLWYKTKIKVCKLLQWARNCMLSSGNPSDKILELPLEMSSNGYPWHACSALICLWGVVAFLTASLEPSMVAGLFAAYSYSQVRSPKRQFVEEQ
jgi:hypothetical protein